MTMSRSVVPAVAFLLLFTCFGCGADSEAHYASDAERVQSWVAWLADDAREGRGVGTEGLVAAETWLAERFAELGLEPAGEDGYFQTFEVPVRIEVGEGTGLLLSQDGSGTTEAFPEN